MTEPYVLWLSPTAPSEELLQQISAEGYATRHASSATVAPEYCTGKVPEIVFIDNEFVGSVFTDLVAQVFKQLKDTPIVSLLNSHQSEEASKALEKGAIDYLIKPFLPVQLKNCLANLKAMKQGFEQVVVNSHVSRNVLLMANRAAQTNATILIQGESGTGKERLARFIHQASQRREGEFVAINCAAIPENMLEAILFGYNKGAFTGAVANQAGKFELANGGTLLLDEISELPLSLQAKLLRALQEREIERLGSNRSIKLDIRIIAASNKDLREQVEQGLFREDLYYRLDVLSLSWPALRQRRDDILPLANFFIEKYGSSQFRLSQSAAALMQQYQWPGNVRELENVIQRAMVLARGIELQVEDLGLPIQAAKAQQSRCSSADIIRKTKQNAEYEYILELLSKHRGHRARTAEALGVSTRALRYKLAAMREHGLDIDALGSADH